MRRQTLSNALLVFIGLTIGAFAMTCARPAHKPDDDARTAARGGELRGLASPAFAQAASLGEGATIADVAEAVVPSVVNISATRTVRQRQQSPFGPMLDDPFFREFFGPRSGVPRERQQRSLGSGVIVSADGVILTNHHVIANADEVQVTTADGRDFKAEIAGNDPESDLAVLRITDAVSDLSPIPFGDSAALRLGDLVLAVGNPFGVGQTVTMGIVSAKGRTSVGIVDYEDFIQTDAAINPGNSGGALVNMRGELVGINTAILSRSGGYQGVGFAIPSEMAEPILGSLLEHGEVIRGWLGVGIQDLNEEIAEGLGVPVERGVVITEVQEDSPAAKAGIERGDVVVAIDGRAIREATRLRHLIAAAGPSAQMRLELYRGQDKRTVQVALTARPAAQQATAPGDVGGEQSALAGASVADLDNQVRSRFEIPRNIRHGVVITGVEEDSVAARAGLRPGDVILEANRRRVGSVGELRELNRRAGGSILLLIYRNGGTMYVAIRR
jgi:serine protease Do